MASKNIPGSLEIFNFFYRSDMYYLYITVFWVLAILAAAYLVKAFIAGKTWDKKDCLIAGALFIVVMGTSLFMFRYQIDGEESPYMVMSACMSNREIFDNNCICQEMNWGDDKEPAWPALISYMHRIFGISFLNPALASIILTGCIAATYYLFLRIYLGKGYSLALTLLLQALPIDHIYFNTPTKESLYIFVLGLMLIGLSLQKKTWLHYLALGVLASFICEIRINGIIVYPAIALYMLIQDRDMKTLVKRSAVVILPLALTLPYKLLLLSWRHTEIGGKLTSSKLSLSYIHHLLRYVFGDYYILAVIFFIYGSYLIYRNREPLAMYGLCISYCTMSFFIIFFSDSVLVPAPHYFTALATPLALATIIPFAIYGKKHLIWLILLLALSSLSFNIYLAKNTEGSLTVGSAMDLKEAMDYFSLIRSILPDQERVYFLSDHGIFFDYDYMYSSKRKDVKNFKSRVETFTFSDCRPVTFIGDTQAVDYLVGILYPDTVEGFLYGCSDERTDDHLYVPCEYVNQINACEYSMEQESVDGYRMLKLT